MFPSNSRPLVNHTCFPFLCFIKSTCSFSIMSNEADLYVSNGTCYYGEGQVSDPRYIPCGNAQLSGVQHCCFEGSYCLSSYACYDTPSKHILLSLRLTQTKY